MRVTKTKKGKLTVTFTKDDDCMRKSHYITDGFVLIDIDVLLQRGVKLKINVDDAHVAYLLGEEFSYNCGVLCKECKLDLNGIIGTGLNYDVQLTDTLLTQVDPSGRIPRRLFHAKGKLSGLVGICLDYVNLIDECLMTCSDNPLAWNEKALVSVTPKGDILAYIMPVHLNPCREIDALVELHTPPPETPKEEK